MWETGRVPLPPRYVSRLVELYGVDRAAIEAVVEIGERAAHGQDASGPRGETPLGRLRAAAGLFQSDVAKRLGVGRSAYVSMWETGSAPLPPRYLVPLAELYGVEVQTVRESVGELGTALGELRYFDALADVRTSSVELSTRLRNTLLRLKIHWFGELRDMSIAEFHGLRGVGSKTADELVGLLDGSRRVTWVGAEADSRGVRSGLDVASTDDPDYVPAPWEADGLEVPQEEGPASHGPAARRELMRDLGEVAAWWAGNHGQARLTELLRSGPDGGMPASVREAFGRLQESTVRELAEPEQLGAHDPVARFEVALLGLDARDRDVLRRRVGEAPETLEGIGEDLRVSRERVRQIETKAARALDDHIREDPDVRGRLGLLRDAVAPLVNAELMVAATAAAFPGLDSCEDDVAAVFRASIERQLPELSRWRNGWTAPRSLHPELDAAREGKHDGTVLGEFRRALRHSERSVMPLTQLLEVLGLSEREGIVRRRPVGLLARALAEMEDAGEPLAFDSLVERVGHDVNGRTLRNALFADDRVVRTDRDAFGLAAWGHETYEPIAEMIARHLRSRGGTSTVQNVVEDLTSRFSVAESSVRAYARSHRFVELPIGGIRERLDDEPIEERLRPLREYAACVRIEERWAYRVRVDEQLLAGYSVTVPEAFAAHLGVEPLQDRSLPTDLGTSVSATRKGLHPFIGLLRPIAEELDLGPGSLLFVVAPRRVGNPVSFVNYGRERIEAVEAIERVGLELGLEAPFDDGDVLRALDLESGAELSRAVALLRARGEGDLADALQASGDRDDRDAVTTDDVARLLGF